MESRGNCTLISLEGKLRARAGGGSRCLAPSGAGKRLAKEQHMLLLGTAFSTRAQSVRGS